MRFLYTTLTYLLRPLAVAVVLWRGVRNPAYRTGLAERFGFGPRARSPALWMHAVSLGEVTAAAPLIRALLARHPERALVLTTATPTGRARARALFGDAIDLRFLPYDTPGSMRRFLSRVNPRLAVILETELWPNLFHQCERRGIPILLANARLSETSVSRYRRLGGLFRRLFTSGVTVAAQSAEDAARFVAIGASAAQVRTVGNLKFDVDAAPESVERGQALRAGLWPARPTWIAGSTHAGEEDIVLSAHALVQMQVPGALLLLVPRHPERFQSVADLLGRRGTRFERRSTASVVRPDCPVLLVDTVGELSSLYAAADVAFVGGSLVPVGGHNLLEPAVLGMPVLTGPYHANAREVAGLLLREGAALEVEGAAALGAAVAELLQSAERRRAVGGQGARVVAANRGTLGRLLDLIEPLWARTSGSGAAP